MSSSVLAFVTTLHLALASLRNHRSATAGPLSSMAAVSLLLAALPWLFPSAIGLAFGIAAHLAWFVVCERLVPVRPAERKSVQAPPAPRPSAASGPSPARPQGFVQVPVLAVFDETPDIKTIRMARPDGFEFRAGQFIAVRVRVDGKDCSRCYSVSSAPEVRGYLEISVKRHGLVSNALHVMARPGALLSVRSPNGAFTYPSGDDRPIVLVAGGVGITPLISMLRHAVHAEPARGVTLLYSARTEADFAFKDEIAALVRRHPQARAHFASSRASVRMSTGANRRRAHSRDRARHRAFDLPGLRTPSDERSDEETAADARCAGWANSPRGVRSGCGGIGGARETRDRAHDCAFPGRRLRRDVRAIRKDDADCTGADAARGRGCCRHRARVALPRGHLRHVPHARDHR
jgi:ferredoxin-NADP reductase